MGIVFIYSGSEYPVDMFSNMGSADPQSGKTELNHLAIFETVKVKKRERVREEYIERGGTDRFHSSVFIVDIF